jgi:hypothetical protein
MLQPQRNDGLDMRRAGLIAFWHEIDRVAELTGVEAKQWAAGGTVELTGKGGDVCERVVIAYRHRLELRRHFDIQVRWRFAGAGGVLKYNRNDGDGKARCRTCHAYRKDAGHVDTLLAVTVWEECTPRENYDPQTARDEQKSGGFRDRAGTGCAPVQRRVPTPSALWFWCCAKVDRLASSR